MNGWAQIILALAGGIAVVLLAAGIFVYLELAGQAKKPAEHHDTNDDG